MEQNARKLAEQLYNKDENRCKPSWNDLQHEGACQTLWTERAQKLLAQQPNS